jgi:uncharacterized membrane protein YgcG
MQKPSKTLADYVAVAISPVLIMLLVGSLAFFLIQVFYRGELVSGIRWVMFWFVLAIVLISRVSIEQGKGHARVYGAALAITIWFYLTYTHKAPVVGVFLLAVTWWCAARLTKDCTLIDEDEDASGEGVFQEAWRTLEKSLVPPPPTPKAPSLSPLELMAIENLARKRPQARARPPGRSVVYFSLAALPLFGFGQLFLPANDPQARRVGFAFLALYLTAALSLLVTTSFLGLRRYLRQRSVEMPASITFGWIKFGVLLTAGVLLLALVLPRPGANSTWKNLTYRIEHKKHNASHYAPPFNPPAEGEGAPTERPVEKPASSSDPKKVSSGGGAGQNTQKNSNGSGSPDASPQAGSGNNGGGAGDQGSGGQGQSSSGSGGSPEGNSSTPKQPPRIKDNIPTGGADQPDDKPNGAEAGESKIPDRDGPGKKPVATEQSRERIDTGKNSEPKQPPPRPEKLPERPPPKPGSEAPKEPSHLLRDLLRWLLILALSALFIWLAIRYRKVISEKIRAFIAVVRDFFRKLFSFRWRKSAPAVEADVPLPAPVLEPFASYENPFLTGKDKTWPPEHLLFYTYEAVQAWAKERGIEIQPQQTPREFCLQLIERFPDFGPELEQFSFYYSHAAFAKRLPDDFETESISRLWQYLGDSVLVAGAR